MRKVLFAVLGIGIGAGVAYFAVWAPMQKLNPRFEPLPADLEIPHASTRGQFRNGSRTERIPASYELVGLVPGLSPEVGCAESVIVVVHGFNNSPKKAQNRFGVARQSLQKNGYKGIVVGFSWDADTQLDPFSATGYREAKEHTEGNGPLLAKFLGDLRTACPTMKIAVIGYSMGARLALEGLRHLQSRIDVVYLVGAAVDNEEVELGERYGNAIEAHARKVVNYFSPNDSKLGNIFAVKEVDRSLGKHDIEHKSRSPKNYFGINVMSELPTIDDSGEVVVGGPQGANHSGYLGTRNNAGVLTDDGVMNLVARDFAKF